MIKSIRFRNTSRHSASCPKLKFGSDRPELSLDFHNLIADVGQPPSIGSVAGKVTDEVYTIPYDHAHASSGK